MEQTDFRAANQFVRLGYNDLINDNSSFRSMNFTTDEQRSTLLVPAIRQVREQNAFQGEPVADGVSRFEGQLPAAEFGRRGSPILWLTFPMWTHQREGEDPLCHGERISDEEYNVIKAETVKTFVDELHVDSWGERETLSRKLWFWWD